ncbi:MAG: hypothetical protein C5B50_12765 [Verrucomicrobia bacterium]|nr:MAG: hypothetical protein C5B50_12765 [Verrucomicrobiota bacterium]
MASVIRAGCHKQDTPPGFDDYAASAQLKDKEGLSFDQTSTGRALHFLGRSRDLFWCAIFLLVPVACGAQLQLIPDNQSQSVFPGERAIKLTWANHGKVPVETELRARLYQATEATAVLLSDTPWKRLNVLPGQTVLESATLGFPPVKAETQFVIKWIEGTNKLFGTTSVLVYPTNLLSELKLLAGEEPLGVYDQQSQLKPILKNLGVDWTDLEETSLEDFRGKLVILGPFRSKSQVPEGFGTRTKAFAERGAAVVWLLPPLARGDGPQPSFALLHEGKGTVVLVQPEMVADLASRTRSQINLLHLARLALHPNPVVIPFSAPEP